jgi:hypothetical protein
MKTHDAILANHLRYRLWIAELNFYINILRIFDDSIEMRTSNKQTAAIRKKIEYFKKVIIDIRKEIDDLRHEMHLIKMKLAAHAREEKPTLDTSLQASTDQLIIKRFSSMQKNFDKLKEDFIQFEMPDQ